MTRAWCTRTAAARRTQHSPVFWIGDKPTISRAHRTEALLPPPLDIYPEADWRYDGNHEIKPDRRIICRPSIAFKYNYEDNACEDHQSCEDF